MKKNILFVLFAFCVCSLSAQSNYSDMIKRTSIGVQIGTDIGGAIPMPLKYVPEKFNPYPQLSVSLGAKMSIPLKAERWSLGVEATYKKIGMNADAKVENQRFQESGSNAIQYFTGTAFMKMDFTCLEVPLYVKYALGKKQKDRVVLGLYGAWAMKSTFETIAKKGYIGTKPSEVEVIVDSDYTMDFSPVLDSWDVGMIVGYEKQIAPRIDLGLRFMMGFKDIFNKDNRFFDYKMLNMRGSLVLSYDLFELRTKAKK